MAFILISAVFFETFGSFLPSALRSLKSATTSNRKSLFGLKNTVPLSGCCPFQQRAFVSTNLPTYAHADGTHNYVKDYKDDNMSHGVCEQGLQCVCVLMGAYDTITGLPLLGCVYEPFGEKVHHEGGGEDR